MSLRERIESFSELGKILRDFLEGTGTRYSSELESCIINQQFRNPWFTPENVKMAIKAIENELTVANLTKWTDSYPSLPTERKVKNVGVIMAGNIPLVGFHDLLSVLISGHNLIAKTSSKDRELMVLISEVLCRINPGFREKISLTDGFLKGCDAVIATGSDNSSRYFEYYFGKYPHIIRRNRNSLAIIQGNETREELSQLGLDIFSYFGLGCRNVSKLFLPMGYEIMNLTLGWKGYSSMVNHNKYANNYDFNKAVFMVNREEFTDTGYLIFKESEHFSSPVAVLYYEYYDSLNDVGLKIKKASDRIQCVVSRNDIPFGMAQYPHLWDYADEIDTIDFLLKKI